MESNPFGGAEQTAVIGIFVLVGLLVVVANIVHVLIYCKIFANAGYHWAYGLLLLVPIAQLVIPFYLAFADWPVQKELRELRQRTGASPTTQQW